MEGRSDRRLYHLCDTTPIIQFIAAPRHVWGGGGRGGRRSKPPHLLSTRTEEKKRKTPAMQSSLKTHTTRTEARKQGSQRNKPTRCQPHTDIPSARVTSRSRVSLSVSIRTWIKSPPASAWDTHSPSPPHPKSPLSSNALICSLSAL